MSALVLLMPATPMLFQGQEFGASTPFMYFADHNPELAAAVEKGRAEFVRQFPTLASPEIQAALAPPHDPETFNRSKLDWSERDNNHELIRLYRDLIALRRSERAFSTQDADAVDGAVLDAELFALRYFTEMPADERLVIVNLGKSIHTGSFAEPLVAAPDDHDWEVQWSSERPEYGGTGTPPVLSEGGWRIPAHAAIVMRASPATRDSRAARAEP